MDLPGVWRLVKSEFAVTAVIRSEKISDRIVERAQCAQDEEIAKSTGPERGSSVIDFRCGRQLSSRCESVSAFRSSAQANKWLRVQSCLSHSSGRSRSVNLPRRRMCSACGGRRRQGAAISTVRIPCVGDVAQLGEHLLCKQGVGGSSPLISTSTLTTE